MQYEQFSDKAKQIIELVKNCENKSDEDESDPAESWYSHNMIMIYYNSVLFNIENEFNQIYKFCHSKNYWRK